MITLPSAGTPISSKNKGWIIHLYASFSWTRSSFSTNRFCFLQRKREGSWQMNLSVLLLPTLLQGFKFCPQSTHPVSSFTSSHAACCQGGPRKGVGKETGREERGGAGEREKERERERGDKLNESFIPFHSATWLAKVCPGTVSSTNTSRSHEIN